MRFALSAALFALLQTAAAAHGHMPLCMCADNGDNTITCQGGFSDGSSAAGVTMRILATDGRLLMEGRMDEEAEFTFQKPRNDFVVLFDAGPEHQLRVPGRQIAD